ncbi:MAG TPA: helix-turn-helix domain-containing protein [Dehalococcoidia bacterium]|nr:helix-turn-helix domain-containing protein [Dehalococcoidia bacterium]
MAVEQDLDLITVKEAAQLLRVSQVTIHRWLKQGRLRAYHVGPRALRLRREDLANLVLPVTAATPAGTTRTGAGGEIPRPRRLSDEEVRRGLAALERSRQRMARMRAERGAPLGESWPIIRAAREDPARHW